MYSILVIAVDIDTVWESDPAADVSVPEIVHDTVGHVPHTGLLASISDEFAAKLKGSEVIFVTHQPDKSWLKSVASLNISVIVVTSEESQSAISWLNLDASLNK